MAYLWEVALTETETRKRVFAANLQGLLDDRNLTVREVARRAGIKNVKRLYRWASHGIARADYRTEDDLERLVAYFSLASVGALWRAQRPKTLAERLREAGEICFEFEYAFKVFAYVKTTDWSESEEFRNLVDDLFDQKNLSQEINSLLEPKTPEQIVSHLEIEYGAEYRQLLRYCDGSKLELIETVKELQVKGGRKPHEILSELISLAFMEAEPTNEDEL